MESGVKCMPNNANIHSLAPLHWNVSLASYILLAYFLHSLICVHYEVSYVAIYMYLKTSIPMQSFLKETKAPVEHWTWRLSINKRMVNPDSCLYILKTVRVE